MNLTKNLLNTVNCPICKEKEFLDLGKINNCHPDLRNLFNLLECINCKHWFLSKMPTNSFLDNLYNNNSAYVYHKDHVVNFKKGLKFEGSEKNHWIFKQMKNEKKGSYLEIGPGNCKLLKTFRNHGWYCEGLELSKWIKIEGVTHDITKLSKKNKNVLVLHDVLEHVSDPLSFLKEFSKQQSPGDKLFLAFPNSSSFKAKILKTKWPMVVPMAHLNFFSINSTKVLLEKSGYKPLIIKEASFVVLRKLIRNTIRLPITLVKDLIKLDIKAALNRFSEIFLNILDLIKGDQLNVVGIKK